MNTEWEKEIFDLLNTPHIDSDLAGILTEEIMKVVKKAYEKGTRDYPHPTNSLYTRLDGEQMGT